MTGIETSLLKLLLPDFIVEHFEVCKIDQHSGRVDFYLEEKALVPEAYQNEAMISHGFHKQSVIRDFPVRGKQVYLYIRRRRWLNKKTNEVVSIDWGVTAKGTRMTGEFAAFLKGLD